MTQQYDTNMDIVFDWPFHQPTIVRKTPNFDGFFTANLVEHEHSRFFNNLTNDENDAMRSPEFQQEYQEMKTSITVDSGEKIDFTSLENSSQHPLLSSDPYKILRPDCDDDKCSKSMKKRRLYTRLEQKRRLELNLGMETLKDLLPGLVNQKKKPSKVKILEEATSYCEELKSAAKKLKFQKKMLESKQHLLREKLNLLYYR